MLGFVEEIVLLQLDPSSGRFTDLPLSAADVVVAGAALMDLAIKNRLDTDLEQLTILDDTPTGDDILDDVLARLAASEGGLTTPAAIELAAPNARHYRQSALKRLSEKGILRERDGLFLRVFQARRYPVVDDRERREVRARLRQLLLTEEIPDPRDVVLICLLEACELLSLVLTAEELGDAAPRIERLGRLDLIGQAMKKAVAEIRFIVRHAATPS